MVWSRPVRMADLVQNPAEVFFMDDLRFERYDFSNEFVSASVMRNSAERTWEIDIQTHGVDGAYAQAEVADAVMKASQAVSLLNKPAKSVAADEALSNEIRVLLAEREWTFKQAAAEFGIELGRFGNLVCGQTRWTTTDMYQIAEAISDDPEEEFARLAQIGRRGFASEGDAEWLTPEQTCQLLGLSIDALADMRRRREGPRFYKPHLRTTVYRRDEVQRWLDENDN